MYKFLNRPVSPHLSIYLPQNSSLSSIWHRFSAFIILFLFLLVLVTLKLTVWNFTPILVLKSVLVLWKLIFCTISKLIVLLSLFYHCFSGLRHITWDFNFLLTKKQLTYSFYIVYILLFTFLIIDIILKYI